MQKQSKIIYFIVSILFFVILDIFMSDIIIKNINSISASSVLDLVLVRNQGAAFSLLENSGLFLILFAAAAAGIIIFYTIRHIQKTSMFMIFWSAMLSAGIFCNMLERAVFGFVRDFFKLNFVDFPVFNISDIFINLGVIAIVIIILKDEISNRRINRSKKN